MQPDLALHGLWRWYIQCDTYESILISVSLSVWTFYLKRIRIVVSLNQSSPVCRSSKSGKTTKKTRCSWSHRLWPLVIVLITAGLLRLAVWRKEELGLEAQQWSIEKTLRRTAPIEWSASLGPIYDDQAPIRQKRKSRIRRWRGASLAHCDQVKQLKLCIRRLQNLFGSLDNA